MGLQAPRMFSTYSYHPRCPYRACGVQPPEQVANSMPYPRWGLTISIININFWTWLLKVVISPPCARLCCLLTCKHLTPVFSDLTSQILANETYSSWGMPLLALLKSRHLRYPMASSVHTASTHPPCIVVGLGVRGEGLPRTVDDGLASTPLHLCPRFQRLTKLRPSTSPICLGLVFSNHAFTTSIPIISPFARNLPIAGSWYQTPID